MRDSETDRTPRSDAVDVSVVIPCQDEAATIGTCVRDARQALRRHGYRGEVVVCDNGSTDSSGERARQAGARVVREARPGYGRAVRRALQAARGDLLLVVDGDGTYDLALLPRFIEPLRSGYDVVMGTRRNGRMLPGAMGWLHRHILEPMQTWLLRRRFDVPVSDVRCGMRSLTREAWEAIEVDAPGAEWMTEMLIETSRHDLESVEVPVRFAPRRDGPARRTARDSWRVVRQLLMVSPTHLFVVPGGLMLLAGLTLEMALLPGPLWLGGQPIDYHWMFLGGALALLGLQVVLIGLYAKTYFWRHGAADLMDEWIARFHRHFALERGLAAGGLLFVAGLALDGLLLARWMRSAGPEFFAVRPALFALTLMVIGAEVLFGAFLIEVLRGEGEQPG